MQSWYTPFPFVTKRFPSQTVKVGSLKMGSNHPVLSQSMANTSTHDVDKSVNQAIEIFNAGGELVRYTVINQKDADALETIKAVLIKKGYQQPIVADVHFNAALADSVAKFVDKVRINPGNYLDKRASFKKIEFTENEYKAELLKIEERLVHLLQICTQYNTALRIGTNHGSLSDRIMSRYGDTPEGMAEATMEFLRICKKHQFKPVVVSLKSSNTRVMIQAYRLMAKNMLQENLDYCLHLGVTEAGSGEDGRIKSAVGIGALMNDGLGDTIRVSLTEHPAKEIPVTKELIKHFEKIENQEQVDYPHPPAYNPYLFKFRNTENPEGFSPGEETIVVADLSGEKEITQKEIEALGFVFNKSTNEITHTDLAPDVIYTGEHFFPFKRPKNTSLVVDNKYWDERSEAFPLFAWEEYKIAENKSSVQNWVQIARPQLTQTDLELIKNDKTLVLVNYSYHANPTAEQRLFVNELLRNEIKSPVIHLRSYNEISLAGFQLKSAADLGVLFLDGLSNGIWLKNTFKASNKEIVETSFSILQASRCRVTKTEYISCPSCGRTLFDLEKTVAEVKKATTHLKGLKIAIMGCIVNGPGEMADADYGYVGAGPGKVSLYKGKKVIKKNIDAQYAVKELLLIIENDNSKNV